MSLYFNSCDVACVCLDCREMVQDAIIQWHSKKSFLKNQQLVGGERWLCWGNQICGEGRQRNLVQWRKTLNIDVESTKIIIKMQAISMISTRVILM